MIRLWGGFPIRRRVIGAGCAIVVLPTIAAAQLECEGEWAQAGQGLSLGTLPSVIVLDLLRFDADGDGPGAYEMYACGAFKLPGETGAGNIGRWDGFQWTTVGGGLSADGFSYVNALLPFDFDGQGPELPKLVAAGSFHTTIGEPSPRKVAFWDGEIWVGVGELGGQAGWSLVVHDFDGNGPQPPRLVTGGAYYNGNNVSWWDDGVWRPLPGAPSAWALVSFDPDAGGSALPTLFAARQGGPVVMWSGTEWVETDGVDRCRDFLVVPPGASSSAPRLMAATLDGVAEWNGSSWVILPVSPRASTIGLLPLGDGLDPLLVIGAESDYGELRNYDVIFLDSGGTWRTMGAVARSNIYSLRAFDEDDAGPRPIALFAGGLIESIDSQPTLGLGRWSCPFEIERCLADLDATGAVDFGDVAMILGEWGERNGAHADANRDGVVGFNDVSMVLGLWGSECAARPYDAAAARGELSEPSDFDRYITALGEFDGSPQSQNPLDAAADAVRRR